MSNGFYVFYAPLWQGVVEVRDGMVIFGKYDSMKTVEMALVRGRFVSGRFTNREAAGRKLELLANLPASIRRTVRAFGF